MRELRWSLQKSAELKKQRGVSFEEIIQSRLVAVKRHPKRSHQRIMLFEYKEYIWVVPCIVEEDEIFLKTLFPSRKYTKIYHQGGLT